MIKQLEEREKETLLGIYNNMWQALSRRKSPNHAHTKTWKGLRELRKHGEDG
jgi:hypothetical protein